MKENIKKNEKMKITLMNEGTVKKMRKESWRKCQKGKKNGVDDKMKI